MVGSGTALFRFPWFCINRLAGECVCVRGTMEYSRGRRTLERTRRVDLDVNYRSPSPDVPRGGEGRGKEKERESRTGRKREVGKENVVEKKTPKAQPAPSQTGRR